MKKFSTIAVFLVLLMGCSYQHNDVDPTNNNLFKRDKSRQARYGCYDQYLAITSPNAELTLTSNYYSKWRRNADMNVTWRTREEQVPRAGWGLLWYMNPTAIMRIYGPAPDYPFADSVITSNTGMANFFLKPSLTEGYYYLTIQTDGAACDESAVDFIVKDF